MEQLPKRPLERPTTPPATITWIGLIGEAIQVPITPANVLQVDLLFQQILEGELQLDPETAFKLQKLRNAASKAIANSLIQRTTNTELITAELTKKKRSNRERGRNYVFGRVLNGETLREREAFNMFKEY